MSGTELKTDILNPSDDTNEAINYLTPPGDVTENGVPATVQGVSRGNDSTTELLIQPSTTGGVIEDDSFGGGGLIGITIAGVTVDGSNNMVFDGSSDLRITAPQLSSVLNGSNSWTISVDITPDTGQSGDFQNLWIEDGTSWPLYWEPDSEHLFHASYGQLSPNGSVAGGVKVNIAQEYWMDGATRTLTTYIDGSIVDSRAVSYTGSLNDTEVFPIGSNVTGPRYFNGLMNRFKIDSVGLHQGTSYSVQSTDYLTPDNAWSVDVTEETVPALANKQFGRNSSDEPIEITTSNNRKDVVYDLGNTSGGASINHTTNPATLYRVTGTAAITGWTFTNFPTDFPFKLHVTGNFDIAYGMDGTGNTANQDGLKVFDVVYDGTNYQMSFENSIGGDVTGAGAVTDGVVFVSDGTSGAVLKSAKVIMTVPASNATITIASAKTFTCSNTLTLSGTDTSTLNIGTGGTLGTAAYTASTAYTPALITQNAQTGTSYTLVLTDINKLVTMSNASANALTVPLNASIAYSVGTTIAIQMIGAGVTTISGDTGVTINGVSAGSSAMDQYQTITLIKIATDTWLATGGTFA